jgi:hypothetical protein
MVIGSKYPLERPWDYQSQPLISQNKGQSPCLYSAVRYSPWALPFPPSLPFSLPLCLLFWQYQCLNLRPCTCQAGALPLEPHLSPFC